MSVMDTLITDRSAADVARWQTLRDKGWANMTTAERAEWLGALKGAYNYTDLNRVGNALLYLQAELASHGYTVTYSTTPKTNWSVGNIPTTAQMTAYLANVSTIRAALAVPADTPTVPGDMNGLTVDEANNIEAICAAVEAVIYRMAHTINLGWCLGIADIGLYGGIA